MAGSAVKIWEEIVHIPTYPVPVPDLNPMFLEKRVYQGSSGKVYPNPVTDRLTEEKVERPYRAVFLENDFVQVMLLPEIGGRIHRGLDKTNQYDFFYYQHVIKPALVGLLGPWISGGVEINWPQHHRPSTFMPIDYRIEQHADGSATAWLSEHETMDRTKGMAGIRLYPDRAFVEVCAQLYNRTPFPQTFLWWANAGVHVHEEHEAFFPPDVTYVADHAKRAISQFPIARGYYYSVDYTRGVDLRWYRNIPVPTSYMVAESEFNFVGGYDHRKQAGVVHVADHHIAPGKKLWTWGCGDFGQAWDRELTDFDGPYDELMAGLYTDNQPDFSWIHPYETRTFRHGWYPIQKIGPVKNATRDAAVSLAVKNGNAQVGVCVTQRDCGITISLSVKGTVVLERSLTMSPGAPFLEEAKLPGGVGETDLLLLVCDTGGRELVRYQPRHYEKPLPGPATEPKVPAEISSADELYVAGLHLEQYRHATRSPESYWGEAVRRDPADARCNNGLGLRRLRRGAFAAAEEHFRRAIERLTERNPNPFDGEPYYNLGLALKFQSRLAEAHAAFAKATWNYGWQSAAHYELAAIACGWKEYGSALEHLEQSLANNTRHTKARNLKAAVMRRLGRLDDAARFASETGEIDPVDFWSQNELLLLARARGDGEAAAKALEQLSAAMRGEVQTYLDIAYDYTGAGLLEEACDLLERVVAAGSKYPIALYTLGALYLDRGDRDRANEWFRRGAAASPDYCFPARLQEMLVLEAALTANPNDPRAHYYLGNLLYDKQRYDDAIDHWERSCALDSSFSIPWRNLGIAYFNVRHDSQRAAMAYDKAFSANPSDARLLYERDQLQKRMGASPEQRLGELERYPELVERRDDLTIELVTLYNQTGKDSQALDILLKRRFHPWEGGEGLASAQFVWSHVIRGEEALAAGSFSDALAHFEAAQHYPHNLGEGKHLLTPENHLHYFAGMTQKALGDARAARSEFEAAQATQPLLSAMSYYRALAARELGDEAGATKLLQELLHAAEKQLVADVKIEYFATSLPNFLLFADDLRKRNRVDCLYLIGLAQRGLGKRAEAEQSFQEVLALDLNHLGAKQHLKAVRAKTHVG